MLIEQDRIDARDRIFVCNWLGKIAPTFSVPRAAVTSGRRTVSKANRFIVSRIVDDEGDEQWRYTGVGID